MRYCDAWVALYHTPEGILFMAVYQNKHLRAQTIAADRAALLALKQLHDYMPTNAAIRIEAVSALEAQLRQAEEAEILLRKTLRAARGARIAASWQLHNTMLDVKAAVAGQYGSNSDAVQALGLKKKMDYRRPASRREEPSS
jgi:hypothetical protein